MKRIAIFSNVPLWTTHFAEVLELAIKQSEDNKVVIYSCNRVIEGCPANPGKNKLLCTFCRTQTNYSKKKLMHFGIEFRDIDKMNIPESQIKFQPDSHRSLSNFEYNGYPVGRLTYSTLASETLDTYFDLQEQGKRVEKIINNGVSLYEYFKEQIKTEKFDELYAWNGRRHSDGSALNAAKNTGIKYVSFISGGGYNAILVRENCETINDIAAAKNDMELIEKELSNPEKRAALVSKGLAYLYRNQSPSQSLEMNFVGFYAFHEKFSVDSIYKKRLEGRDFIVLFVGTFFEFAGIPGFDNSQSVFGNFYQSIEEINKGNLLDEQTTLVIRWHPNAINAKGNEKLKISELIEQSPKNILHIPPSSNMDSYWLIENSSKVVSLGSSIALEAAIRGKPTAFIGNNLFENLTSFVRISSWKDLQEFFNNGRVQPEYFDGSIIWGVFFSSFGKLKFERLHQKSPGKFYFKGKSIEPRGIRLAKFIRKSLLRIISLGK